MSLEQYTALVKTMSSSKMSSHVIESALKDVNVFVFGGMLELEPIKKNIQMVAQGQDPPDCPQHFRTLYLFAYGTWSDYVAQKQKYIELTPPMANKLKMLSLASACSQKPKLSYEEIAQICGLNKAHLVDEVDSLVLSCISSQLLEVRIDQKNLQVITLSVSAGINTGRDVQDVQPLVD